MIYGAKTYAKYFNKPGQYWFPVLQNILHILFPFFKMKSIVDLEINFTLVT